MNKSELVMANVMQAFAPDQVDVADKVTQALIPQIQQFDQQSTQAILRAIQSIPQTQGFDPAMLGPLYDAIQNIPQPDMTTLVAIMASLSEQVDAIPETPTEWNFDIKRDSTSKLITGVRVSPA